MTRFDYDPKFAIAGSDLSTGWDIRLRADGYKAHAFGVASGRNF